MSAAVIAARIGAAVAQGALPERREPAAVVPIAVMGDLLRPWEEIFPGIPMEEDGNLDLFAYGGLRRPRFFPHRRLSGRPLPALRRVAAPVKPVNPGMFQAAAAIADFYRVRGLDAAGALAEPVTDEGFDAFLSLLRDALGPHYPLGMFLEDMAFENTMSEQCGVSLLLPHFTYDDEAVGVMEAFLSGEDSVHSLLQHYYGDSGGDGACEDLELPPADRKLIEQIGLGNLIHEYARFRGEKSYDLQALESWGATYFHEVYEQHDNECSYSIITDDPASHCEVWIRRREDIEFAIAYEEAFCRLMKAMPSPVEFDTNEGGAFETFLHEVCNVYRQAMGKRTVRWTSPKRSTLAYRMRTGDL